MAASKIVAITIFALNTYMKIGLSQSIITHDGAVYDAIEHGWYRTIPNHCLFFVPNTMNQDFDIMANDLDSLIITGGAENALRRSVELELVSKMIARGKPVVGISRGAFLIAELIGGSIEPISNHNEVDHPIFYHREVREVNSNHDYCIKSLPDNTNVICLDYLGNPEAFINGNASGIVWNPEQMTTPWIPPEIAYMLRI
jgi:gamma-glutamyl-gamma-aminobutyrate hydrolase PuuD